MSEPECCKELRAQVAANTNQIEKNRLAVFGDGNGNHGLIRKHDSIHWKLNAIIWGLAIIGGALLVNLAGNLGGMFVRPPSSPVQNQNVRVQPSASVPATVYTTAEVATMTGYSEREIQDRASKGEIPGAYKDGKAWRFDVDAVDDYLAARAASAVSAEHAADTDAQR